MGICDLNAFARSKPSLCWGMKSKLIARAITQYCSAFASVALVSFFFGSSFIPHARIWHISLRLVLFNNTFRLNYIGSSNINDANNLVKQFNYKWLGWSKRNGIEMEQKFIITLLMCWKRIKIEILIPNALTMSIIIIYECVWKLDLFIFGFCNIMS